jgi:(p)ppGpp synthase/HD superfamily hydrolase
MKEKEFKDFIETKKKTIEKIAKAAADLHDKECNQKYDEDKPYSFHLEMVAKYVMRWGYLVCGNIGHIIPMIFSAYFHDAIEDARMTYNDIMKLSRTFMDKNQALTATEIVYALTDEKGRNRAERGSEKHYQDIRDTLYAPFVKFCDRYSNWQYSVDKGSHMAEVYRKEMPLFLDKLGYDKFVPKDLVNMVLEEINKG